TNLKSRHAPNCGRTFEGKSSHQPAPATETVTARTITTSRIPQPTLAIAWPTAPRPDQMVRPMSAAIPPSQATTPACLTIPPSDPHRSRRNPLSASVLRHGKGSATWPLSAVAGYHGVLTSKECVAPNPKVTWSGEPFCVTSGEPAGSPLSRSYSTKTRVAHCGGHRQRACAPAPYERIPPLVSYIGRPDLTDWAGVMLKYGVSAGVVANVSRGPADKVNCGPTGTTASVMISETIP